MNKSDKKKMYRLIDFVLDLEGIADDEIYESTPEFEERVQKIKKNIQQIIENEKKKREYQP